MHEPPATSISTRPGIHFALFIVICLSGYDASAQVIIQHDPIECLARERHTVLKASVVPSTEGVRLYFRASDQDTLYFVDMVLEKGDFQAVLPRPSSQTQRVSYFIRVSDPLIGDARTPAREVQVLASEDQCRQRDPSVVYFSGNEPHITLRSSQKGASPDPSGFELDGIRRFEPAPGEWVAGASAAAAQQTIVFVNGSRMAIQSYEIKGGTVQFTTTDGKLRAELSCQSPGHRRGQWRWRPTSGARHTGNVATAAATLTTATTTRAQAETPANGDGDTTRRRRQDIDVGGYRFCSRRCEHDWLARGLAPERTGRGTSSTCPPRDDDAFLRKWPDASDHRSRADHRLFRCGSDRHARATDSPRCQLLFTKRLTHLRMGSRRRTTQDWPGHQPRLPRAGHLHHRANGATAVLGFRIGHRSDDPTNRGPSSTFARAAVSYRSAGGSADLAVEMVGILTPRILGRFGIIYLITVTNFGPGGGDRRNGNGFSTSNGFIEWRFRSSLLHGWYYADMRSNLAPRFQFQDVDRSRSGIQLGKRRRDAFQHRDGDGSNERPEPREQHRDLGSADRYLAEGSRWVCAYAHLFYQ